MRKRRASDQQELERRLAREFFSFVGWKDVRTYPGDRPDVLVTGRHRGRLVRAAAEITEFYGDTLPGAPSLGRQLHEFWGRVREALEGHRESGRLPGGITGHVYLLDAGKFPKARDAEQFAGELVKVAASLGPITGVKRTTTFPSTCPLARTYVKKIVLRNLMPHVSLAWECPEERTAWIGVTKSALLGIVGKKAARAAKYHWPKGRERWLLISASGTAIVGSAGPYAGELDGIASEIASLSLPFDVVAFWDRMHDWCKQIYPERAAVCRPRKR